MDLLFALLQQFYSTVQCTVYIYTVQCTMYVFLGYIIPLQCICAVCTKNKESSASFLESYILYFSFCIAALLYGQKRKCGKWQCCGFCKSTRAGVFSSSRQMEFRIKCTYIQFPEVPWFEYPCRGKHKNIIYTLFTNFHLQKYSHPIHNPSYAHALCRNLEKRSTQ